MTFKFNNVHEFGRKFKNNGGGGWIRDWKGLIAEKNRVKNHMLLSFTVLWKTALFLCDGQLCFHIIDSFAFYDIGRSGLFLKWLTVFFYLNAFFFFLNDRRILFLFEYTAGRYCKLVICCIFKTSARIRQVWTEGVGNREEIMAVTIAKLTNIFRETTTHMVQHFTMFKY
jgi:hypothetical protein